jgi:DNA polymerase-3 subunit delta'
VNATNDLSPSRATPGWPIIGHEGAVRTLARAIESGQVHHAYLLAGPAGLGRTTLAFLFAQALLCEGAAEQRPCGTCRSCQRIARRVHPDVTRIGLDTGAEEAKQVSIDQVRELRASLSLRPLEGAWRVAIVDDAERLSREAADALLKTLEEPPPYAVLVLVAEDAQALPETIRSRCQTIVLQPLPIPVVARALEVRGAAPELANRLARETRGRIALAFRLVSDEAARVQREKRVAEVIAAMTEPLAAIGFARRVAEQYRRGRRAEVLSSLQLALELWRDALWLAADPSAPIVHEDARTTLERFARRCGIAGACAGLSATLQALADLEANVQARLALDAAMVTWAEVSRCA